ncbi:probable folate-biopterin transporter 9, chloroplastic [Dendrobium catenatum]|uniref:Putative folate-biopterin transporter 9, chloroplastic n=1 Tax=Dendrobium catenatum TaxID=906689 RepID=A0A2I0VTS7_9ASPA|nr:probable folate-biopterin transporter 9, chloroplastic [Dendrobium catenatum]PKU66826.1 putative folate-biopterin transporter 9, chloroplastic [Dendrobium catenatum]
MACPSKPMTVSLNPLTNLNQTKLFSGYLHLDLPISYNSSNGKRKWMPLRKTHLLKAGVIHSPAKRVGGGRREISHGEIGLQMWSLCGFGYWVQGFRCFPWLALNFYMSNGLGLSPSMLQLVQSTGNLPMVAKPLFGFISDAVYIGGGRRLPYISIGAFLQALSWCTLALVPTHAGRFPTQMACILLSNLGASVTEVVSDALVAEFSKTRSPGELQSFAFTAVAAGGLLGNLLGGFLLLKLPKVNPMFFSFSILLTIQLVISLTTKEISHLPQNSLKENLSKQFTALMAVITQTSILYPLLWIVASNAVVPLLSGSLFCFQTQCLNLDSSVIGLSKVVGQLIVLCTTLLYNQHLKSIPMRKLISVVQVLYALSFISDLLLVKQINVRMGISNEVHVLCISSLAESLAQFKTLPFTVLFSRLCPLGYEGSLFAFFASAMCLSSIVSGVFGVGLASLLGVSSENYSSLPLGIVLQVLAAFLPLGWISHVPMMMNLELQKPKRQW